MIGTDLDLDLPSLSDPLATIVSKFVTAISAVADSIASKVTPSAFNINTALDLGGNALTEASSVQFASGNVPSNAGSLYYYQGNFYAIDTVGAIQLTDNGALNASAVGAIVGDYGGINPARVSYDDASGQYRFTEDTGVWADLVAKSILLQGANAVVTIGVDPAMVADRTVNFKSLPSSGKSLLVYNAATETIEDAAVTAPTNVLKGPVTIDGNLTVTDVKLGERHFTQGFQGSYASAGTFAHSYVGGLHYTTQPVSGVMHTELRAPLNDKLRLKKFVLAFASSNFPTVTITKQSNGPAPVIATLTSADWTQTTNTSGAYTNRTYALTVPSDADADSRFIVNITNGAVVDDVVLYSLTAVYESIP